jgi:hypothetical protein
MLVIIARDLQAIARPRKRRARQYDHVGQETETVRFKVTPGNSIFCVRFSPGRIRIIT